MGLASEPGGAVLLCLVSRTFFPCLTCIWYEGVWVLVAVGWADGGARPEGAGLHIGVQHGFRSGSAALWGGGLRLQYINKQVCSLSGAHYIAWCSLVTSGLCWGPMMACLCWDRIRLLSLLCLWRSTLSSMEFS